MQYRTAAFFTRVFTEPLLHTPPAHRSVVASAAIRAGEVVIQVPDDVVLMGENCGIAEQLEGEWGGLWQQQGVVSILTCHSVSFSSPRLFFLEHLDQGPITFWSQSGVFSSPQTTLS